MEQEITINKLPEWNNRSEVLIGDFHVGIMEQWWVCRPCNIKSIRLYIPNHKKPFRLDQKNILESIKKVIKLLNIEQTINEAAHA